MALAGADPVAHHTMTTTRSQELIQAVNDALDPVTVLNLIGFAADRKVLSGTTLRAPCPVHQDEEFLTLFINTRKKTAKCTVESCPACQGGSLVELYGWAKELSPAGAARELALKLGLPVDLSSFHKLAGQCFDEAEEFYVRRELPFAIAMAQQALAIDDTLTDALVLLSKIHLEQFEPEQAATCLLKAAKIHQDAGRHDEAERCLRRGIQQDCQPERLYDALTHLLLEQGRKDVARDAIEKHLNLVRDRDDKSDEIALLVQLAELDPDTPGPLERLAQVYLQGGRDEDAIDTWLRLAEFEQKRNRPTRAITYLDLALKRNPDFVSALEWKVEIFEAQQDRAAASQVVRRLAELAQARGDLDGAQRHLERLVDLQPQAVEPYRDFGSFLLKRGQAKRGAEYLMAGVKQARQQGLSAQALAMLETLLAAAPTHLDAREQRASVWMEQGKPAEARTALLELAEQSVRTGNRDEALRHFRHLLMAFEGDVSTRRAVLDRMAAAGYARAADRERLELVKLSFQRNDFTTALELAEAGLELDAGNLELLAYRIELLGRLGRADEIVGATLAHASALERVGQRDKAEGVLRDRLRETQRVALVAALVALLRDSARLEEAGDVLNTYATQLEPNENLDPLIDVALEMTKLPRVPVACWMALAHLEEIRGNLAGSTTAWKTAAASAQSAQDLETAREAYDRVVKRAPKDGEARLGILQIDILRGDWDKAWRTLDQFIDRPMSDYTSASADMFHALIPKIAEHDINWLEPMLSPLRQVHTAPWQPVLAEVSFRLAGKHRHDEPDIALDMLGVATDAVPERLDAQVMRLRLMQSMGQHDELQALIPIVASLIAVAPDPKARLDAVLTLAEMAPKHRAVMELIATRLDPKGREKQILEAIEKLSDLSRAGGDAEGEIRWLARKMEIVATGAGARVDDLQRLIALAEARGHRDVMLDATLMLAQLHQERDNPNAAAVLLQAARRNYPLDPRPREMAVSVLRALDRDSELIEEIVGLGDLAASNRKWSRAEMYFREAQQLDPDNPDIQERLAQNARERGETQDAQEQYLALAKKLLGKGDTSRALDVARQASLESNPSSAILTFLADLQEKLGQADAASGTLLLLAQVAVGNKDTAALGAIATRAIALAPRDPAVRRRLGELHAELNLMDNASRHFAAAAKLLLDKKNPSEAEICCREALTLNPENRQALETLLAAQRDQGDREGTSESLKQLASSQSIDGNFRDAITTYNELLAMHPTDREALVNLSECLQVAKRHEEATVVLRRLLALLSPDSDADLIAAHGQRLLTLVPQERPIRELVAQALTRLGRGEEEIEQRLVLAADAIAANDRVEVAKQIERLRDVSPQGIDADLVEAMGEGATGDSWRECVAAAMEGTSTAPALAHLARTVSLLSPTDWQARCAVVARVLEIDMGQADSRKAMQQLLADVEASKSVDTEALVLDSLLESIPNHPDLLQARIAASMKQGAKAKAQQDLRSLGAVHAQEGRVKEAVKCFRHLLDLKQDDTDALRRLAESQEKLGETGSATETWLKLLAINDKQEAPPDTLLLPLTKLSDYFPNEEKYQRRLIDVFMALDRPRNAGEIVLARAQAEERKRAYEAAERDYREALKLSPELTAARKSLAELLARRGAASEAREEFLALARSFDQGGKVGLAIQAVNQARSLDPKHPEPLIHLGDIYARQNNRERAIQAFTTAAARLIELKDMDGAEVLLVRVLDIAPDDDQAHRLLFAVFLSRKERAQATPLGMRLARYFLRSNDLRQAKAVIDRLRTLNEELTDFSIEIAELYREFERYESALDVYLETASYLAFHKQFEEGLRVLDMAATLRLRPIDLQKTRLALLEARGAAPESMVADWRKLADMMSTATDTAAYAQAEEELRNRILSIVPGDAAQHERLFEVHRAKGDRAAALNDCLRLADIADASDPARARTWLSKALEIEPESERVLRALAKFHERHQEMEAVVEALVKLSALHGRRGDGAKQEAALGQALKIEPSNIEALRQMMDLTRRRQDAGRFWNYGFKLATVYEQMGRPGEAKTIYEEAVMMDGGNIEAWQRLADLSEQSGDIDATIRIYKNIARTFSEHQQIEMALSYYERVLRTAPGELDTALEAADLAASNKMLHVATSLLELSLTATSHREDIDTGILANLCMKMLEYSPNRHETRRLLAHLLEERKESTKAVEQWNYLANYYAGEGRPSDALHCLKRMRVLYGSGIPADLTVRIATLEAQCGREDEANRLFTSLIQKARADGQLSHALTIAERMASALPHDPQPERIAVELCKALNDRAGQARHLAALGLRLAGQGDFPGAYALLQQAKEVDPSSLEPLRAEGQLLIQGGQTKEATATFARLVMEARRRDDRRLLEEGLKGLKVVSPEDYSAREALIALYQEDGDETAVFRERLELVEVTLMMGDIELAAELTRDLNLDPMQSPDAMLRLAQRFQSQAAPHVAIDIFKAVGTRAIEAGQLSLAERAVNGALALRQDDLPTHRLVVELKRALNQPAERKQAMERLAVMALTSGEIAEAEEVLLRLVELDERQPVYHELLAKAYAKAKRADAQEERLRHAAELFAQTGDDAKAHAIWGSILRLCPGDEAALRRRVELGPSFMPVEEFRDDYYAMGRLLLRQNRLDEFELLAQEADALMPGDATFASYRQQLADGTLDPTQFPPEVTPAGPPSVDLVPTSLHDEVELDDPENPGDHHSDLMQILSADEPRPVADVTRSITASLSSADEEIDEETAHAQEPRPVSILDEMAQVDSSVSVESMPLSVDLPSSTPVPASESQEMAWQPHSNGSVDGEQESPRYTPTDGWGLDSIDSEIAAEVAGEHVGDEFDNADVELGPLSLDIVRDRLALGEGLELAEELADEISTNPGDPALMLALAEVYVALNRRSDAAQLLGSAQIFLDQAPIAIRLPAARLLLVLEPNNLSWLQWLVVVLYDAARQAEAEATAMGLASQFRSHGMVNEATQTLRLITHHNPHHVEALLGIVALRRGVASTDETALDLVALAGAYMAQGVPDAASATLDEALSLSPESSSVVSAVVRHRRVLGPQAVFLSELTKLAHLYLDESNVSLALGCLDEADSHGGPSVERQELRQIIEQLAPSGGRQRLATPGSPPADTRIERSEAIENFLAVLRLDPLDQEVHRQLAMLYAQTNNTLGEHLHFSEMVKAMETKSMWRELLEVLPRLAQRFPQEASYRDALHRTRLQIRALNVIEGDETQTGIIEPKDIPVDGQPA